MRMSSNIFFVIEYYSIEYHPQRCDDIVIIKSIIGFCSYTILNANRALSDEHPIFHFCLYYYYIFGNSLTNSCSKG